MKKTLYFLPVYLCFMLSACQSQTGSTSTSTATTVAAAAAIDTEDYSIQNDLFKVALPTGMTQNDVRINDGFAMAAFEGGTGNQNMQAIIYGNRKNAFGDSVTDLNTYMDYMNTNYLTGQGITVEFKDTQSSSREGASSCLSMETTASMSGQTFPAYLEYLESDNGYYTFLAVGMKESDLDDIKTAFAITDDTGLGNAAVTEDTVTYIHSLTKVLDEANQANLMDLVKSYEDGGLDISEMQSQVQQILKESWDVTDPDSLTSTIDWLCNTGHNQDILDLLAEYGDITREDLVQKLQDDGSAQNEVIYVLAAYDAKAQFGDSAIKAWDLSRAISVLENGYAAGYLTYEEAMDQSLEVAKQIQSTFSSWDDFNQSYLYGYSYWIEEDIADTESSAAQRAEIVNRLTADPQGPFSIDWNMELSKEW